MNKKSYISRRPRRQQHQRHQKAYLQQANKKRSSVASYRQYSNNCGNGTHWFRELPPHLQCTLGLALMALIGFLAHEHAMSSDLLNLLTWIMYLLK